MRNLILLLTYLLTFSQIYGENIFHFKDSSGILNHANFRNAYQNDLFSQISAKGKEQNENTKSGYQINKIVLDAGHGGKDPGCSGAYSKEKDITLAIIKKAGTLIKARFPDVDVIYTRDKDIFVPLNERANIANRQKADLFISVHCNAVVNGPHVKGSETYVLGLHRQNENLAVAKRENASITMEDNYTENYGGFDPKSDEGNIFLTMFQNAYMEKSMQFAALVEKNMVNKTGRKSYGVKQAGFVVLWATAMPSILIETGYLTNAEEENLLSSETGQDEFAKIILASFEEYKSNAEGNFTALPASNPAQENVKSNNENPGTKVNKKPETPKTTVVKTASQREISPSDAPAVIFKIQLSASSAEIKTNSGAWTQLDQLEKVVENNMYKYMTGNFRLLSAAVAEKARLQTLGFTDAFIVAYQGSNRITLDEARRLTDNP